MPCAKDTDIAGDFARIDPGSQKFTDSGTASCRVAPPMLFASDAHSNRDDFVRATRPGEKDSGGIGALGKDGWFLEQGSLSWEKPAESHHELNRKRMRGACAPFPPYFRPSRPGKSGNHASGFYLIRIGGFGHSSLRSSSGGADAGVECGDNHLAPINPGAAELIEAAPDFDPAVGRPDFSGQRVAQAGDNNLSTGREEKDVFICVGRLESSVPGEEADIALGNNRSSGVNGSKDGDIPADVMDSPGKRFGRVKNPGTAVKVLSPGPVFPEVELRDWEGGGSFGNSRAADKARCDPDFPGSRNPSSDAQRLAANQDVPITMNWAVD